jgi:SPP1 family predicted phage head-tail adaptor
MKKNLTSCLRKIITIQRPISQADGIGGMIEKWDDFITVSAEVQALYDKALGEGFFANQVMDNSFYRFRIRYLDGIKTNMRLIYNQKIFHIKRVINQDERNLASVIIAQENVQ